MLTHRSSNPTRSREPWRRAAAVAIALLLTASTASIAQEAPASDPAFEKGTYVVRTTDGAELRGQLERMDHDSLRLRVGTQAWDLPMDRVDAVQRRGDSLKNGAVIGALLGGGLAAVSAKVFVEADMMGAGEAIAGVAAGAAFYGLIGAGIDKLISSNTTLYKRPGIALAPTRGGVTVAYRVPLGGR